MPTYHQYLRNLAALRVEQRKLNQLNPGSTNQVRWPYNRILSMKEWLAAGKPL